MQWKLLFALTLSMYGTLVAAQLRGAPAANNCGGTQYAGSSCQFPVSWKGLSNNVPTPLAWMSLSNLSTSTPESAPFDYEELCSITGSNGVTSVGQDVTLDTESAFFGTVFGTDFEYVPFINCTADLGTVTSYTFSAWVAPALYWSSDSENSTPVQLWTNPDTQVTVYVTSNSVNFFYGTYDSAYGGQIQLNLTMQNNYIYQIVASVQGDSYAALNVFEYDTTYTPTSNFPVNVTYSVNSTQPLGSTSLNYINSYQASAGSALDAWDIIIWNQTLSYEQITSMYDGYQYPNEVPPVTVAPPTTDAPTTTAAPTVTVAPTTTAAPSTAPATAVNGNNTGLTIVTASPTSPYVYNGTDNPDPAFSVDDSSYHLTTHTIVIIGVASGVGALALMTMGYACYRLRKNGGRVDPELEPLVYA